MSYPPLSFNAWLRFDLISRIIDRLNPDSILEIGAGQGAVGTRLAARHRYLGVEPDRESFRVARNRLSPYTESRVILGADTDVPSHSRFDVVCAFEVLEHLEDDVAALQRWAGYLEAGGHLILSVPAHQRRFSEWDRLVGHYRRYDPDGISSKLRLSGFESAQVLMYGGPLGYALEAARNLLASLRDSPESHSEGTKRSGRSFQPPNWLSWATQAITSPFRWAQIPFLRSRLGTGMVVVARKPYSESSSIGRSDAHVHA